MNAQVRTLQSSSLPLDSGGFVVTVVAPSASTFRALLSAINTVNPDAFDSKTPPPGLVEALLDRADDEDLGLRAGEAAP